MTIRKVDPEILRGIDIFEPLTEVAIEQMLEAPDNGIEEYDAKDYIIREKEAGENMYVILDGSVEILIRGGESGRNVSGSDREVPIATLRTGDFFGEQALMPGSQGKRNASIRALEDCCVFRIHKKYVDLNIKRDLDFTITQITMVELPEDKEVREILDSTPLFRGLNEDEIKRFREWTEVVEMKDKELVIKENEKGNFMYLVLEGKVEVYVTFPKTGEESIVGRIGRGGYFGEYALLSRRPIKRTACVRADGPCRLVKVPKKFFRLSLKGDSALARAITTVAKSRAARSQAAKELKQ